MEQPDMEQLTGSKLGKEYVKAVYCHPIYLTYMQSTSCKMPGWMIISWNQIAGRNINHRYAYDSTLMAETEEKLKSLLMRVKGESEKSGLKLHIQKSKIMASGLITSWTIEGKKEEIVTNFIFSGSKITSDGARRYEIKRLLLLGRKTMTNLDSVLKSNHFVDQHPFSQIYVFSRGHEWM